MSERVVPLMPYPRPVLTVGFGRYLRERVLSRLLGSTPQLLEVRVVTCLKGGQTEFDNLVAPMFVSRRVPPPEYVPELADALDALQSYGYRPAVVINTPTALHAAQASMCVAAGLDVYVERPLVDHYADLPALVARADAAGVVLFTGSQRRVEAPFKYLYDAVVHGRDFGELASIRCLLSVGERPKGWRTIRTLAGGGVILDSGHHLLDCAAWVANGVGHRFAQGSVEYVHMSSNSWMASEGEPLESTAVGHARSVRGLDLFFDLSYATSLNAVYERIEVIDLTGARVSVVRDQTHRSSEPGRITHQRADGSIAWAEVSGAHVAVDHRQLPYGSNVTGPLESFLRARESSAEDRRAHPCSGASSIPSWELTREIYRHGSRKIVGRSAAVS